MNSHPRRALRVLGALTLPVVIALAACQPATGGATASPSEAMMDHSASPSEAMMESASPSGAMMESASPSEAMMDHSASPSEAMMEASPSP
jgi:hypothetical protein